MRYALIYTLTVVLSLHVMSLLLCVVPVNGRLLTFRLNSASIATIPKHNIGKRLFEIGYISRRKPLRINEAFDENGRSTTATTETPCPSGPNLQGTPRRPYIWFPGMALQPYSAAPFSATSFGGRLVAGASRLRFACASFIEVLE